MSHVFWDQFIFEVFISVLHGLIPSNLWHVYIDKYTLHLTSKKIGHPKNRQNLPLLKTKFYL